LKEIEDGILKGLSESGDNLLMDEDLINRL
jgi:hypothetical protein